jgi:uncharacterized protein YbaR (Trm112 family)
MDFPEIVEAVLDLDIWCCPVTSEELESHATKQ